MPLRHGQPTLLKSRSPSDAPLVESTRESHRRRAVTDSTVEAETGAEAPPSARDTLPRGLHCVGQISMNREHRSGAGRMREGRICESMLKERFKTLMGATEAELYVPSSL